MDILVGGLFARVSVTVNPMNKEQVIMHLADKLIEQQKIIEEMMKTLRDYLKILKEDE